MLNILSIGGNAIEGQKSMRSVLSAIYTLSREGRLLITHGNGPQVGELASIEHKNLGLITAQTEAEIGLELQRKISDYLEKRGMKKEVEVVLTEVLVDRNDKAFKSPTKPIGKFYAKGAAMKLARKGLRMKRLIGGYRRVVASPMPKRVLNVDSIKELLAKGDIVIAGGGGGIPLFKKGKKYTFAEAVIDKDYASSLLAISLSASRLTILTKVNGVYLDYGSKNQRMINRIRVNELSRLLSKEGFEEGSIKPKLRACIDFVKATGKIAVIGGIGKAEEAVALRSSTVILP